MNRGFGDSDRILLNGSWHTRLGRLSNGLRGEAPSRTGPQQQPLAALEMGAAQFPGTTCPLVVWYWQLFFSGLTSLKSMDNGGFSKSGAGRANKLAVTAPIADRKTR